MITITNSQKRLQLKSARITKIIQAVLRKEKYKAGELTFVFVNSSQIKSLNKKYLGHLYATDVLAFDFTGRTLSGYEKSRHAKGCSCCSSDNILWGDIIISTDAIIQNTKRFKTTASRELALYVVHGLLHLLGYDDHKNADIKAMRLKEEELLQYLGKHVLNLAGS
jgi:probable rRNA maturation factor